MQNVLMLQAVLVTALEENLYGGVPDDPDDHMYPAAFVVLTSALGFYIVSKLQANGQVGPAAAWLTKCIYVAKLAILLIPEVRSHLPACCTYPGDEMQRSSASDITDAGLDCLLIFFCPGVCSRSHGKGTCLAASYEVTLRRDLGMQARLTISVLLVALAVTPPFLLQEAGNNLSLGAEGPHRKAQPPPWQVGTPC